MKITFVPRKFGLGLAAIVVAAGVAAGTPSQAQDNMMMKERVALMKNNGKNLGIIGKAIKGEMAVDLAALGAAAANIGKNANKLKSLFPAGSGGGESRALPAIWEKRADFDAFLVKLASASDAFAREAATGKMANLKASFGAMASNCGGCHKVYRAEKKK